MTAWPHCCHPRAFELFAGQLARLDDSPDALLYAAVAIGMHELPEADPVIVDRQISDLAEAIRRRVTHPSIQSLLAHGHELLFEELGFAGNVDDYYDPTNSYLPLVLETRRGIPITLALVYVEVMRRLGVPAEGVAAPGHFLVAVRDRGNDSVVYIDPFNGGRLLTEQEVHDMIEQIASFPLPQVHRLLPVAAPRLWLTRMLRNLQAVFAQRNRSHDFAAMRELAALL